MKPALPTRSSYQPQMDGLRALAVFAVLLHHYEGPFYRDFNFGTIGVRFFFVASGFLITRILLKARRRCDDATSQWRGEMMNFQMRRLGRTLPAYYLSLLLAVILAVPPVRETLGWTLSFLTNVYIATLPYFPDTISHFWSLAVQEQFYLFWPFLVFFLPKSWIKYSLLTMIASALLFRFWCITSGASDAVRWFSLPSSLDTLAIGGLLACVFQNNPALMDEKKTRWWSGLLALFALVLANKLRTIPMVGGWSIWIEPLEAVAMAWMVGSSVQGFQGWVGRALSWRPLTYVGKISYGIYVYHVLTAILLHPFFARHGYGGEDIAAINLRFFVQTFVTIAAAILSWHYFEQPILLAREKVSAWFGPRAEYPPLELNSYRKLPEY